MSILLIDGSIQFDSNSDCIVENLVNSVLKSDLNVNDLDTGNPLFQMELDIIRELLRKSIGFKGSGLNI
jgi:hypothetical protein